MEKHEVKRMKRRAIRSMFLARMVRSYSLILIMITSIFTLILYWILEVRIQNSTIQYQEELVEKTARQLDDFLSKMDDAASRVMSDSNVVILFTKLNNDHDMNNYFKENILDAIDMGSVLKTINGSSDPSWRISVYDQYGDFISSGAVTQDYSQIADSLTEINVDETMTNLKYSNRMVISQKSDKWSNYFKSEYISILRPVMNKYARNVYAIVEVQEDVSKLKGLLQSGVSNMQMCIYDEQGNLIISQGEEITDKKILKTVATSKISGWKVELTTVNQNKYLSIIAGLFVLIYLILVVSIILITYVIGIRITRPLQDLRLAVNKISPNNISIETNEEVIDEIKELSDAFSEVLMRMGEAANEEKKAYSLALQSQMNPHFLVNLLSVISATGMESGNDKVVDMCQQVVDMLRYVASYESSMVSFKDEITHTKNYLKLMSARYEECFSYDINVDNKINDIIVPKLILQPLVENCFKDAFNHVEPPWKIHIDVGSDNEYWYIRVEDNGIGFAEEQIKLIDDKVNRYSKNIKENYKELKIGGLGLVSTITRLRLSYNSYVEYTIKNLSEKGTVITIRGKIENSPS